MLQRSFWRISKSAMTIVNEDGDTVQAFVDTVVYDESPQFAYVLAAQWERPDIEAAAGTREDLSRAVCRGRYLRTSVARKAAEAGEPHEVLRVKASAVETDDTVLEADVPSVLFAGDSADDVIGRAAVAEAARRIAAEKAPAPEPIAEP